MQFRGYNEPKASTRPTPAFFPLSLKFETNVEKEGRLTKALAKEPLRAWANASRRTWREAGKRRFDGIVAKKADKRVEKGRGTEYVERFKSKNDVATRRPNNKRGLEIWQGKVRKRRKPFTSFAKKPAITTTSFVVSPAAKSSS